MTEKIRTGHTEDMHGHLWHRYVITVYQITFVIADRDRKRNITSLICILLNKYASMLELTNIVNMKAVVNIKQMINSNRFCCRTP